jgi:hypothetical protein
VDKLYVEGSSSCNTEILKPDGPWKALQIS